MKTLSGMMSIFHILIWNINIHIGDSYMSVYVCQNFSVYILNTWAHYLSKLYVYRNFGYLMWRTDSMEKTLMLGKIEGRRRREWQRMRWLDGIIDQWTWVCSSPRIWWWTGQPGVLQFMGLQTFGQDCATELKWTEYSIVYMYQDFFIHSCVDE